jgi:hypothetical protein
MQGWAGVLIHCINAQFLIRLLRSRLFEDRNTNTLMTNGHSGTELHRFENKAHRQRLRPDLYQAFRFFKITPHSK